MSQEKFPIFESRWFSRLYKDLLLIKKEKTKRKIGKGYK